MDAFKERTRKMKKLLTVAFALAFLAAALPVQAGDYKCSEDAQTCLTSMAEHLKKKGWVGIEMDVNEETGLMTIVRVVAESPAEAAGFQKGDQMVAFNGLAYGEENKAALKEAYGQMIPGNTVTYTVKRVGEKVDLKVHLAAIPETVMAQWVGQHMLEHHAPAVQEEEKLAESP